ncbi:MAG: ABC transporter substrate-binding protein [Hyphomicrobiales bacterium]|nr:ABC transporter substrate-binding protein [Hyphomicrobiales bacterium]
MTALAGTTLAAPAVRAQSKIVKVGMINPVSGHAAAFAQEIVPMLEFMFEKINKAGGIKSLGGAQIQLVAADDASQAGRAANEARRLISQENVSIIVGTFLSDVIAAVAPVLDQAKVPAVSVSGGGARGSYFYTLGLTYDRGYAETSVNFLNELVNKHKLPLKKILMVYANYEGGQQVNKYLLSRLKEFDHYEVIGEVPLDMQAQDYTSAMVRIRSMAPDAIMGAVLTRGGTLLQQARYSLNFNDAIFIGNASGYSDPALWKNLGEEIAQATLTRNLFSLTTFSKDLKLKSLQDLLAEIQATGRFNHAIGQNTQNAAQAARVVQHVLEIAGSTDPQEVNAAFSKLSIKAGDPDFYYARPGGLEFGADHLPKDISAMFTRWLPDHSQQVVYPSDFAEGAPPAKT